MQINVQSADETLAMIQQLRAKHLKSAQPASPMSKAGPEPKKATDECNEETEEKEETDEAGLKNENEETENTVSYDEWQKKHFNNILQCLEKDQKLSRQVNDDNCGFPTEEKITVERVEYPERLSS